jgi:exopolysaccharide biosynthesis protein
MKRHTVIAFLYFTFSILYSSFSFSQIKWINVDSLYQPLPSSVHVYFTDSPIDTSSFRAFYLIADLKDKKLDFTVDTSKDRRLTPSKYYERNDKPLVVVNCTFFSFETNRNLNAVIKNGKLLSYNQHSIPGRGKDTLKYKHTFGSVIGISKKGEADVAWLFTDSITHTVYSVNYPFFSVTDSSQSFRKEDAMAMYFPPDTIPVIKGKTTPFLSLWTMKTAVGGGPVLLQNGEVNITNNQELKFAGKAINDKHPRTAMGYTKDGKLIILVVEGRNKNAGGATLTQEAQIFKDLGCWEALNLDGGGSSCLLVNGKETIKISDAAGQRPVPAVFIIKEKK